MNAAGARSAGLKRLRGARRWRVRESAHAGGLLGDSGVRTCIPMVVSVDFGIKLLKSAARRFRAATIEHLSHPRQAASTKYRIRQRNHEVQEIARCPPSCPHPVRVEQQIGDLRKGLRVWRGFFPRTLPVRRSMRYCEYAARAYLPCCDTCRLSQRLSIALFFRERWSFAHLLRKFDGPCSSAARQHTCLAARSCSSAAR